MIQKLAKETYDIEVYVHCCHRGNVLFTICVRKSLYTHLYVGLFLVGILI